MIETVPPCGPYPQWEVTGTATDGYIITINVMQSGNIDVKQGDDTRVLQFINVRNLMKKQREVTVTGKRSSDM